MLRTANKLIGLLSLSFSLFSVSFVSHAENAAATSGQSQLTLDENLVMSGQEMDTARGGRLENSDQDLVKIPDEIGKEVISLGNHVAGDVTSAATHLANIASGFESKIAAGAVQQDNYFVSDHSVTMDQHLSPENQDPDTFLNP